MKSVSNINLRAYGHSSETHHYERLGELLPAEHVILQRLKSECSDRPILDLGVGGGRTTRHLLAISSDYVGIDYSAPMINACRKRFPGVRFEQADARELPGCPDNHFGLIVFSYNGMDYTSHEDRLLILRRMRDLLAPGGWLMFSSHNRLFKANSPLDPRRIFAKNPLRLAWRSLQYCREIFDYLKLRPLLQHTSEYEMRAGIMFHHVRPVYFIEACHQLAQLEALGYEDVGMYNQRGDEIRPEDTCMDPWIHYLARVHT